MALGYWTLGVGKRSLAEDSYRQAVAAAETFGADGALDLSVALTALGSLELIRHASNSAEPNLAPAMTLSAPWAPENVGPAPSYPEVVFFGAGPGLPRSSRSGAATI